MASTAGKRRGGFSLAAAAQPQPAKKTPKVKDLMVGELRMLDPSSAVRDKLVHNIAGPILAIDVEAHAFVPNHVPIPEWHTGRFGVQTKLLEGDLEALHVIQVGWTCGEIGAGKPAQEAKYIKANGFSITTEAAATHGITDEHLATYGMPMRVVLSELVEVARAVHQQQGRLCSHNLEFDAGLVAVELARADMQEEARVWAEITRDGLCTMDPDVGYWVRKSIGAWDVSRNVPMRLADMVRALLPDAGALLARHHDAGNDSLMHWLVATALVRACQPS